MARASSHSWEMTQRKAARASAVREAHSHAVARTDGQTRMRTRAWRYTGSRAGEKAATNSYPHACSDWSPP
eukprot:5260327-Pleurochrysis_carterae.AAC.1